MTNPFYSLRNGVFAKLYLSQTISLLGDAFTWVGLALLAYQLDPNNSSIILATALTLRVTAFIIFSPFAGVVADRVQRKTILLTTHFVRMLLVCSLPFIDAEWQIYVVVFFLNVFNAFFTPTYKAIIPQVMEGGLYREAIGLSTATFQLLGILGPALAGIVSVWWGPRQIFFVDGISFLLAMLLLFTLPGAALQKGVSKDNRGNTWNEVISGIRLLFGNKILRFALSVEFVSAIAGAVILVNTIGLVKEQLLLEDNKYYGWLMAFFGLGAGISAFILGGLDKTRTRSLSLMAGVFILGIPICFANSSAYPVMLFLWFAAGIGQSLAEMPSETLIGENIPASEQGKVYGSHFAFSHLWWAISYPIAGFLGTHFEKQEFLIGGVITLLLGLGAYFIYRPNLRN